MKAVPIELTPEERAALERMAEGETCLPLEARRAKIILACADTKLTNTEIAQRLGVERPIIVNWRKRFAIDRMDGLRNLPGAGRTATITEDVKGEIIALTLHTFPDDAPSWTSRSLGQKVGLSHTAIAKVWKEAGIIRAALPVKPDEQAISKPVRDQRLSRTNFVRAMKKGTKS